MFFSPNLVCAETYNPDEEEEDTDPRVRIAAKAALTALFYSVLNSPPPLHHADNLNEYKLNFNKVLYFLSPV